MERNEMKNNNNNTKYASTDCRAHTTQQLKQKQHNNNMYDT